MTETWRQRIVSLILALGVIYILLAVAGVLEFELITFQLMFCLGLLFLPRSHLKPKLVDDPVAHIQFIDDQIVVGETSLPISKIRKVALDKDERYGYFSLPFNHIKPGVFPNFIFSPERFDSLNMHLKQGLPHAEIVR